MTNEQINHGIFKLIETDRKWYTSQALRPLNPKYCSSLDLIAEALSGLENTVLIDFHYNLQATLPEGSDFEGYFERALVSKVLEVGPKKMALALLKTLEETNKA